MKIGRLVFQLSYEEQQEKCYSRAFDSNNNRAPSYDMPLITVAEQILMDKLNDWIKEKTPQIISINLSLPILEVFYKLINIFIAK